MELTKEQIQYIDNRLEKDGMKYWDIRIEVLDHVVSDVENRLKSKNVNETDFKNVVQESFVSFGWKENFNGSSFKNLNTVGWKNINFGYRKMYFQGFIDFFKNPLNLFLFVVSFIGYYVFSTFLEHSNFIKMSYFLFALPMILYFYIAFKTWRKKYGKSIHKDYGLNYMFLSFTILNVIMLHLKTEGNFNIPITYHKPLLFIIIPLHSILSHSGYQVYKKAISRVEKMRKELLS
ncbi:hypothetical protein [Polaribacter sp. SA4-12]|uniref:hypothetical protein n=1 Tax=Polaribacter sp. SA4-12 TaxID=1312072 RepID=UPI000B3BF472|nr:hypothetical protein [Polaribacter sp. SA4-12]ARV15918.1 hypothetical protein BTO07_12530 [Polaribacter sp. SA4-12]